MRKYLVLDDLLTPDWKTHAKDCVAICDDFHGKHSKILLGSSKGVLMVDSQRNNEIRNAQRFMHHYLTGKKTADLCAQVCITQSLILGTKATTKDYYDCASYLQEHFAKTRKSGATMPQPASVSDIVGTDVVRAFITISRTTC